MEWAGLGPVKWQVEKWQKCWEILEREWPNAKRYKDVTQNNDYETVGLICGGDPCQGKSNARSIWGSKVPDFSGHFLAVVGRKWPRWVVRENVLTPDHKEFAAALEVLGYGAIIVRIDAATFTGQSRKRDFVIGCYQETGESLYNFLSNCESGEGNRSERLGTREVVPALTTHRTRYDTRDCYIWEPKQKVLRILDADEREAFAGFPKGWTAGLSEATRARMYGECVVPQVAQVIGEMIKEFELSNNYSD